MMSVDNLFEEWRSTYTNERFIEDGVFNKAVYSKQKTKILYILKETNNPPKNNLCEYLLSQESKSYHKTWNNIARWTKAVLEGGDYPKTVSKEDKTYWL